jgi:cytidylate kinase
VHSPLTLAPDAVHVDTDGMTAEDVVARILDLVRGSAR